MYEYKYDLKSREHVSIHASTCREHRLRRCARRKAVAHFRATTTELVLAHPRGTNPSTVQPLLLVPVEVLEVQAPVPPLPQAGWQKKVIRRPGVLPIATLGCVWLRRGGDCAYRVLWSAGLARQWTWWNWWTCNSCSTFMVAPDPCALAASHFLALCIMYVHSLSGWGLGGLFIHPSCLHLIANCFSSQILRRATLSVSGALEVHGRVID